MPFVHPLPMGQNVTMVRGISERARSLEALRNQLALSIGGPDGTIPGAIPPGPWIYPQDWPSIQVNVGASGLLFTLFGAVNVDGSGDLHMRVGPGIDGVDPQGHGFTAGANVSSTSGLSQNGGVMILSTGLTPGFHTVTLGLQTILGGGGTATRPWLAAWVF